MDIVSVAVGGYGISINLTPACSHLTTVAGFGNGIIRTGGKPARANRNATAEGDVHGRYARLDIGNERGLNHNCRAEGGMKTLPHAVCWGGLSRHRSPDPL